MFSWWLDISPSLLDNQRKKGRSEHQGAWYNYAKCPVFKGSSLILSIWEFLTKCVDMICISYFLIYMWRYNTDKYLDLEVLRYWGELGEEWKYHWPPKKFSCLQSLGGDIKNSTALTTVIPSVCCLFEFSFIFTLWH